MLTVETDGRHSHVHRATARSTSTVMTFAGKGGGRTWVARDRVGVAYHRHDALKNEAAYARQYTYCLLYTSPSPRDGLLSRMPSSA